MDKNQMKIRNISVTGHRFIPEDGKLKEAIRQVLDQICKAHKETELVLYSALAEGSDQLVAEIALEMQGTQLCVPLPKPVETYLKDFYSATGEKRFRKLLDAAHNVIPLSNPEMKDAYEVLGEFLVGQADILIAVWNGTYNHKKGGTGEVVQAALAAEKPIYWIYCPNNKPGERNTFEENKQIGEVEILLPNNSSPTFSPQ
jgi:hypothetical protein